MPLLEIACFNSASAHTAASSGASRIELCKEQEVGGTTPLRSTFQALKKSLSIPVYVMIRPHSLSFQYTEQEIEEMEKEIKFFKDEGADGFVFGALSGKEGLKVDFVKNKRLVDAAEGRPCTFHRAFDELDEGKMEGQLEELIKCGFKAVLTSGGKKTAAEGKHRLRRLVDVSKGRIDAIIGGNVRSSNVAMLKRETGAVVFHSSAIVDGDGSDIASEEEVRLLRELIDK